MLRQREDVNTCEKKRRFKNCEVTGEDARTIAHRVSSRVDDTLAVVVRHAGVREQIACSKNFFMTSYVLWTPLMALRQSMAAQNGAQSFAPARCYACYYARSKVVASS